MSSTRILIIVLSFLLGSLTGLWAETTTATPATSPKADHSAHVGMDGHLSISLPAPQVFVKRQSRSSDLLVQIVPEDLPAKSAKSANSEEGAAIHYTITYTAFVPGDYNLADSLVRMDAEGQPVLIEQAIPVNITSLLPADHDGALIAAKSRPYHLFALYNILAVGVCLIWGLLLLPLIYWGRKPHQVVEEKEEPALPSIEEILEPLLKEAQDNQLDDAGKAKLEKVVLLKLRNHLKLEDVSPHEMISTLKQHPKSAKAIEILESWLHKPHSARASGDTKLSSQDYQELVTTTLTETRETEVTESSDSKQ